jgi:hypothetical protein
MRREEAFFGEQELALLYIVKRVSEGQRLEAALDAAELDYLIEIDTYMGGFLFRRELQGAFFYVTPADQERGRAAITAAGFKPYIPDVEQPE